MSEPNPTSPPPPTPPPPPPTPPQQPAIKAERLLAELDRLRKDLEKDPSDLEWLTLHHVFCFVSYKMTDFRKYVEEESKRGGFNDISPE